MLSKAMRYLIPMVEDRVGVGRWGLAQEREREKRETGEDYTGIPGCAFVAVIYVKISHLHVQLG